MTELVKALSRELRDSVDTNEAIWRDIERGKDALRGLIRTGLEALWLNISATPERQLLTYETTTYALRRADQTPARHAIAHEQYTFNDSTVADMLERARSATDTRWSIPLHVLSRFTLNVVDGVVLRWLVDNDGDSVGGQLDLLSDILAGYAEQ